MTTTPPDNSEWIDELLLEIALGEKVEDIEPLDIRQLRVKRATDRIAHTEAKAQIIAKLREARIDEVYRFSEAMINHKTPMLYRAKRIDELESNSPQGEEAETV